MFNKHHFLSILCLIYSSLRKNVLHVLSGQGQQRREWGEDQFFASKDCGGARATCKKCTGGDSSRKKARARRDDACMLPVNVSTMLGICLSQEQKTSSPFFGVSLGLTCIRVPEKGVAAPFGESVRLVRLWHGQIEPRALPRQLPGGGAHRLDRGLAAAPHLHSVCLAQGGPNPPAQGRAPQRDLPLRSTPEAASPLCWQRECDQRD